MNHAAAVFVSSMGLLQEDPCVQQSEKKIKALGFSTTLN
jgi:hypothetical protein